MQHKHKALTNGHWQISQVPMLPVCRCSSSEKIGRGWVEIIAINRDNSNENINSMNSRSSNSKNSNNGNNDNGSDEWYSISELS